MRNHAGSRRLITYKLLRFTTLLGLSIAAACNPATAPGEFSTNLPVMPTPLTTSIPTATPTYSVVALEATVRAIAQLLPTATPIPGLGISKQEMFQDKDLWERAWGTASALYPPPRITEPPASTATPRLTPWPTRPLPPHQNVENGTIYPAAADDPLCRPLGAVNLWEGHLNNQPVAVCAGTKKYVPVQGAIQVQVETGNGQPSIALYYETPEQGGAVHVIDATGTRVILRSSNDTVFIFDLLTRQWVPPGPTPVPSLPPSPVPSLPPTP